MKITTRKVQPKYSVEQLVKTVPIKERAQLFSKLQERVTSTVSKEQLETLYHIDGILFRDVNDYVDKIVGSGYYLEGDENLVQICEVWLDKIKAKRLFEEIIKDIYIAGAGNAFLELGYTADGSDIPLVRILNPKLMDYIRDNARNVELDSEGNPVGFVKARGFYQSEGEWRRDRITVDGKVVWNSDGEEDGRDRIAHFKLFGLGESWLGMSPAETVYKVSLIRLNLEDQVGESVYRSGGIIATVGSESGPRPTPEVIDKVVSDLQNVDTQSVFGFPVGVKLDKFPSPDLQGKAELLVYFAAIQSIGIGVPVTRHLLPGVRSVGRESEALDVDYELRVLSLQDRLAEQVREKLLYRMLKARKLVTDYSQVPKLHFRTSTPSMLRAKMDLIARLARRGGLSRDPEVEKYVREELGLPTTYIDRELEMWERDAGKVPTPVKETK